MSSTIKKGIGYRQEKWHSRSGHIMTTSNPVDWYNGFYADQQASLTLWHKTCYEHLRVRIQKGNRLLDVGCGLSPIIRQLAQSGRVETSDLYGIEQSSVAVRQLQEMAPGANIRCGSAAELDYSPGFFDYVIMLEVIEHLAEPRKTLEQIQAVTKVGGFFILSFPNYVNLPWLAARWLAEVLNRPSWVVLQPIDRIYFSPEIIRMCREFGFRHLSTTGGTYFPPLLNRIEPDWLDRALNRMRLGHLSYHPLLVFEKTHP